MIHGTSDKPVWSCAPAWGQPGQFEMRADVGIDHPVLLGLFFVEPMMPVEVRDMRLADCIWWMERKLADRRAGLCPCGDCH